MPNSESSTSPERSSAPRRGVQNVALSPRKGHGVTEAQARAKDRAVGASRTKTTSPTSGQAAQVAERLVGPPNTVLTPAPGDPLTPEQLGFGKTNPFLSPALPAEQKLQQAEARLETNLAQAILDQDRARSMGTEGPVLAALYDAAMGLVPPRGRARFRAVTDEQGQVRHLELLSTNRGFDLWRAAANKALRALSGQTLRAPKGRRIELILDLESKVQLPSGRSPGAGVNILGIPLKEKRFKDSPEISLLKPTFKLGDARKESGAPAADLQLGVTVLGINGDLTDIGAVSRQVIHGKLVRQRVL